jgi:hypothetical protein
MEKLVYRFGVSPIELVDNLRDGEMYVASSGDLFEYVEGEQELKLIRESPLDETLLNNTVEKPNWICFGKYARTY